ncbi:hypothetical protein EGJ53_22935 [Pseudomonas fluorescens]|nr:hypothetical protein EGJ53_22935 [Pseudomonas fluorescens]
MAGWRRWFSKRPTNPCGSELARESGGSVAVAATDTTPSRASSLPQGPGYFPDSTFAPACR